MESWIPGTHGGTYGGNAVSCAAAEATVRVLQEEGLVDNAARLGQVLLDGLRGIQARCSLLGDVRGLGLMVGAEFSLPGGAPATALVKEIIGRCQERGLLLLNCGTYGNVIRWIPPLVVKREEIESALAIFEAAVAASA
jgi:4-aminobutyrate aminotransferase